jgi:copper resistance protein B
MKSPHYNARLTLLCACALLAHAAAQAQTATPAGTMQGMSMGPMQGGKPPPGARDPNAYAEGARRSDLGGMEMADDMLFGRVLFNSLELAKSADAHGQNIEMEGWYGGDYDKVWLKAEGERSNGRLDTLRTEGLWNRAIAPFWSTQLGVRHDTGSGNARNWLAFGVEGLAPYWFETEATGYWRAGGGFGARIEVRYELLFTQRLILEPDFGANVYSKTDRERATGAGLSDLELGLRLRYEIRRQFAPYVGVLWTRKFGGSARFAEMSGGERQSVAAVAGVRVWY